MSIEFKEGAVCFADGECHYHASKGFVEDSQGFETSFLNIMNYSDFQLNTIKQGDYIPKSELNTEDKYNRAVEVFGLFGFSLVGYYSSFILDVHTVMYANDRGQFIAHTETSKTKRKITFNQLMAIGEIKRLMNERESNHSVKPNGSVSKVNRDIERNQPKNKSKQAYEILESLDYEYDLGKQQWFRKEWV